MVRYRIVVYRRLQADRQFELVVVNTENINLIKCLVAITVNARCREACCKIDDKRGCLPVDAGGCGHSLWANEEVARSQKITPSFSRHRMGYCRHRLLHLVEGLEVGRGQHYYQLRNPIIHRPESEIKVRVRSSTPCRPNMLFAVSRDRRPPSNSQNVIALQKCHRGARGNAVV